MFGKLLTLSFLFVTVNAFYVVSRNESIQENTLDYRLPTNVVPIHYDLNLESGIAARDFNFTGETNIEIEVRESTKNVTFNWRNLILDEAQTRLKKNDGEFLTPKGYLYDYERQFLTVLFDDVLLPGIYTLHLEFSGKLSETLRGFYRSSYVSENGNERWLALTHFQPISARTSFPCWDEPAFKATFNISIKHHANYTALSNMPMFERSIADDDGAKVWSRFEKTPVMSTHILAFIIFDFENVSTPDGTTRLWARKSIIPKVQHLFEVAQKVDEQLKEYMNRSVGLPKMDHVVVPDFSSKATENWGLITYWEKPLSFYSEDDDVDRVALLVAHEMTHQWVSNLVGPNWWKYMWMSEGFSAYFEHYIISKVIEDSRMMDVFLLQVVQENAFVMDICPGGHPMNIDVSSPSEIYSVYSIITYRKAPSVLRMLSHLVSEEVFRAGLLKYLHAHRYNTAEPDDLWSAMQDALDQSDVPHEGFRVKEVMDTWTEQEGYPTIVVDRDYDTGTVQVRQVGSQSKYVNEVCNNTWWVPLNFATQENLNFSSTLPTHWLSPSEETKTIEGLPKDGWIIANVQQTGYYRVQYDLENWKRLAGYLNSDNYKNIHVLNRVQIINEAIHALSTKKLPHDVFRAIFNYISRETDPLPWMAVYYAFEDIEPLFDSSGSEVTFKPYIGRLLNDYLNNMGYEDRPEDEKWTRSLRSRLKSKACLFDVPECCRKATVQLIEYLKNPDSMNITESSEQWVFCYGLRRANQSTWNSVLDLFVKTRERKYLHYLSCSDNKDILENFLNMTLSDNSLIPKNNIINLYDDIISKTEQVGKDAVVDFYRKNIAELKSKFNEKDGILSFLEARLDNSHLCVRREVAVGDGTCLPWKISLRQLRVNDDR